MFNRKQYMAGECDFWTYYRQFATPTVIQLVQDHIGEDRIKLSTDQFFNDIPLARWQELHRIIGCYQGDNLARSNASEQAEGTRGVYSLSDTVCVAKAAAQIIKECT